jgi:hypothetical protein
VVQRAAETANQTAQETPLNIPLLTNLPLLLLERLVRPIKKIVTIIHPKVHLKDFLTTERENLSIPRVKTQPEANRIRFLNRLLIYQLLFLHL